MNDDHADKIADKFYREVRNKILADVYHHFKGKELTGAKLARTFGLHPQEITNLETRYYPTKKDKGQL